MSSEMIPTDVAAVELRSLVSSMSATDLTKAVKKMTELRKIIKEFVVENLDQGVDYGIIEATSKSGKKFLSKPTLFKPGQEKIFSLFALTSECVPDWDTWKMLGEPKGTVALICNVYKNGVKITEGRGTAVVGEKQRDGNSTTKIAQKRARMDACLSLGFSEYFTQDLDTMADQKNENLPTDEKPASQTQLDTITIILTKLKKTIPADQLDNLTEARASAVIGKLEGMLPKGETSPREPELPPLDDEYKAKVKEDLEKLKTTEKMRIIKDATNGRIKLGDDERDQVWRSLRETMDKPVKKAKK